MTQALSLWGDLVSAYHGKNGFGGRVAEIYAYRLMGYSPSVATYLARPSDYPLGSYVRKNAIEELQKAAASLRQLIEHFEGTYTRKVVVKTSEGDVRATDWLKAHWFDHRIHIEVTEEKT